MAEIASPIAGGIRAVKNTVSSSVFSTTPTNRNNLNTSLITPLLVQNSQGLKGVATDLGSLNQQVVGLRNSLNSVKQNLEVEASLTRQREAAASAREEKLINLKLREGKEGGFERKIQNALVAPVAKIGNTTRGVLGRLGNVFKLLFFGWLGRSTIDAYNAISLRNIDKLKEIGVNVGKTLLTIGGVYLGSRLALRGAVGILGRLAVRATGYSKGAGMWKPFKDIRTLIGIAAANLAAFAPLFFFGKNKGEGDKNWFQRRMSDISGENKDDDKEDGSTNIDGTNQNNADGLEETEDKYEKYSIRSLWDRFTGGNKKSNSTPETQTPSIKPQNKGLFGGLFNRKQKPQKFDPYKEYNQGEFVSVRDQVSKIDEFGLPQPVDKSEFYNQKEDTSGTISPSSSDTSISSIKRDPGTSDNLASLPEEEPVIVPIPQDGGGQEQPSGGSVLPGSGQGLPQIRPTNFSNTYVYHAYQQFNLSPVA